MSSSPSPERPPRYRLNVAGLRITLLLVILGWTFAYNMLIKGQHPVRAFFKILDTISDDFVGGSAVALAVGCGIVIVFSVTKLYTQVIAHVYSFRILEDLVYDELFQKRYRRFFSRLMRIDEQPTPDTVFPTRISSLVLALCLLYTLSWVYVLLFSEALYFVCWSAGVRLPLRDPQSLLLVPMLAMAIPFSARVMAYIRYPYAQDYADFMPGALFVLLLVGAMGKLYGSSDHVFFLVQVFENREFLQSFLRNGAFLAFIPLFFEAAYWFTDMQRWETAQDELDSKPEQLNSEESV
ncbi:hypothetical protein Pla52o_29770 [Novipirellula galeiformis]|uniref:Uncharacterized protein n=1 Tax=Novipirellula galeiformis TaxID=2528004 RepID=A0A5C6CJB7_9BACT|nr:hypothetical protein [Novipirellula galeiformis]TWU23441.1 hypothetical protein Pla52o_29770 [Novipirellula galeiformis]